MAREYKTFPFQLKSSNDELGIIEGYLSVFNVVDQGNDRVKPGAFKRTLTNSKKRVTEANPYIIPMLWQHKDSEPIGGVIDAEEDDHGLFTRAQFDLDVQRGREAYSGYKKGYLNQLSIGYDTIKKSYDAKGVRDLEELRLWEQSTVTFAMNEDALVTGVKAKKAMSKKDFNSHYEDAQAQDVLSDFWDFGSALKQAAKDAWTIGDQPLADAEDAWNQAKPAFMAWVQRGIDCNMKDYLTAQQQSTPYLYDYMAANGPEGHKAGGMSQGKKDTIQSHIDTIHSMADEHKSSVNKHVKAMHSAADDLATVLQGSEPAYTTDHGTPEKATSPQARSNKDHSSSDDTDLGSALSQLVKMRTMNTK